MTVSLQKDVMQLVVKTVIACFVTRVKQTFACLAETSCFTKVPVLRLARMTGCQTVKEDARNMFAKHRNRNANLIVPVGTNVSRVMPPAGTVLRPTLTIA